MVNDNGYCHSPFVAVISTTHEEYKMKRTFTKASLALIAALVLPMAAFASPADWAGPYIGLHAGYAQDNSVSLDFAGGGSSNSFDMTGALGGIQGGYNWAAGPTVLGIEGVASAADVNGDAACPNPAQTCKATMDQMYSIQGHVGFPINNFLLYASLGGASAQIEAKRASFSDSAYQTGWLAGIGGAMAFSNHWTGLVELQYVDFGSNDYTLGGNNVSVDNKFATIKAGANWKF